MGWRWLSRGLVGEEISLAGRITAVADAYDVITSKRSYKEPITVQAARRELVRCSGTQFDPAVVRAFLEVSLSRRKVFAPLAWLFELPGALNVARVAVTAPAVSVASVTAVGLAATVAPVLPPPVPEQLAYIQIAETTTHQTTTTSLDEVSTTITLAPSTGSRSGPSTTIGPPRPTSTVPSEVTEPPPSTTIAASGRSASAGATTTAPPPTWAPATTTVPSAPSTSWDNGWDHSSDRRSSRSDRWDHRSGRGGDNGSGRGGHNDADRDED